MKKEMSKNRKAAAVGKGQETPKPVVPTAVEETPSSGEKNPASGRPYFEVVKAMSDNGAESGFVLSDQQKKLLDAQGVAIDLLLKAYNSMIELAAVRLECKLSNTRVAGVARELKELIKVMSVYDC